MFEKFQWIQSRWEELSVAIGQPEVIADQAKYQQLLKERAALEPSVTAWESYQTLLHQLTEATEMLEDPDLRDVAQTEVAELTQRKADMEQELRILLLPRDPDDDKNVVIEIRSGTGGDEAHVHSLCRAPRLPGGAHFHQHHRAGRREGGRVFPYRTRRIRPYEI